MGVMFHVIIRPKELWQNKLNGKRGEIQKVSESGMLPVIFAFCEDDREIL
jgi:hypothetical protein